MDNSQKKNIPRIIFQLFLVLVIIPFLPMLISGRWGWWEAWVYGVIFILGFIVSRALAARRHPDILAERANSMQVKGAVAWDRVLAPLLAFGNVLVLLVIGLDALWGGLFPFSLAVELTALVVILAGYVLASYALIENRYFSGVVRLQTDRGHQVVSSGPYRWVRHPGYAGLLLTYLGTPFFLDSLWAFLPTALLLVALFLRTSLEDRFLQDNLEGYRAYAGRVRYRLIPGIW
jgi:protein-S-isoprenylcysteine O-methyltransferase Ste14